MTDKTDLITVPITSLTASKTHLSCDPKAINAGRTTGASANHFKPNGKINPNTVEPINCNGSKTSGRPNEINALKTSGNTFFKSDVI